MWFARLCRLIHSLTHSTDTAKPFCCESTTVRRTCRDAAVGKTGPCFREMGISVLGGASPRTSLPPTESSLIKSMLITACLYMAHKTSVESESTPFIPKTHVQGQHISSMVFYEHLSLGTSPNMQGIYFKLLLLSCFIHLLWHMMLLSWGGGDKLQEIKMFSKVWERIWSTFT